MSAAHWGAVLKRTRLAHVFSDASGLSISLTICLPAEVHKHVHALTHIKKTYSACTHGSSCICTFLPHWMINVLEGSVIILNITCKLTAVAGGVRGGGDTGRLLFKVTVYMSTVKPQLSHCELQYQLCVVDALVVSLAGFLTITTHCHRCVITLLSSVHTRVSDHSHMQQCFVLTVCLTYPTEKIKRYSTV